MMVNGKVEKKNGGGINNNGIYIRYIDGILITNPNNVGEFNDHNNIKTEFENLSEQEKENFIGDLSDTKYAELFPEEKIPTREEKNNFAKLKNDLLTNLTKTDKKSGWFRG